MDLKPVRESLLAEKANPLGVQRRLLTWIKIESELDGRI